MGVFSLICFAFVLHNAWTILVKQKRYNVVPLDVFYLLAAVLTLLKFYQAIWFFGQAEHYLAFMIVGPVAIKCSLGID